MDKAENATSTSMSILNDLSMRRRQLVEYLNGVDALTDRIILILKQENANASDAADIHTDKTQKAKTLLNRTLKEERAAVLQFLGDSKQTELRQSALVVLPALQRELKQLKDADADADDFEVLPLDDSSGCSLCHHKKLERACLLCSEAEAALVAIPCGHLVACSECAPTCRSSERCPMCDVKFTDLLLVRYSR